ncbi:tyrosine-protein phosphatase [Bifidobacterium sp. ESL0790]|uniref:tyrosine-protein phosphatase n=1 Tax=Bifidobacterium sp. ESL0790 TaxID=2983233 RepID=UPI0023F9FB10|nr:tyrosine-protein phosphatase [Bifidobacterium sp. ESL0790]WEV72501.1 tyrosine-protein phosphatase [Bifidobacterium sp. ESL0790]
MALEDSRDDQVNGREGDNDGSVSGGAANPSTSYLDYRPDGDGAGVEIDGVPNARGIGGYPTADGHKLRDGLFFRAAGLNFLGEHGIDDLHRLGIKEVVDLRDPVEVKLWSYKLPADIHVDRVPLLKTNLHKSQGFKEMTSKGVDMAEMYHDIVFGSAEQIVLILRKLLQDDGHPMLIHCTAGKDRTGITSGILMSLLGVDDDMVVSCYAQSGDNLGAAFKNTVVSGLMSDKGVGHISAAQTAMLASPPELMRTVLASIKEEYGSVERYCLNNGMSEDEVAGLREMFLE